MTVFSFTSVTSANIIWAVRAAALESFPDAKCLFGNIVLGYFLDAIRVNLAVSFRGCNFDVLGISDF